MKMHLGVKGISWSRVGAWNRRALRRSAKERTVKKSIPPFTSHATTQTAEAQPPSPDKASRLKRALERHRDLFSSVPAHEVIDISTDVTSAAMRVLSLIEGWDHLRAHIATLLEARACVATTPRL